MNSHTHPHAGSPGDTEPTTPPPTLSRWGRLRRSIGRALATLTWLALLPAAGALGMAWLWPVDLLEQSWVDQLTSALAFGGQVLQFHFGLVGAVCLAMALLLRRKGLIVVATAVAAAGLVPTALTFLPKDPPPAAGATLKVHSFNIFYANYRPHLILPELHRVDADVIVLQEWHDWHEVHLKEELAKTWPHHITFASPTTHGMALFSKRPFIEQSPDGTDWVIGDWGVRAQRVVIEHEGAPLAIYNVHPTSPGSLHHFNWNRKQSDSLVKVVADEPLPVIVAGDFNATPATTQLHRMEAAGFTEAHALVGTGPGWTWPRQRSYRPLHRIVRRLPGIRIDHCFLSPEFTAVSSEVGPYHGSDHRGVIAEAGWKADRD